MAPPFGNRKHAEVPSQHVERLQLVTELDLDQLDTPLFIG